MALVAAAGPMANVVVAIISAVVFRVLNLAGVDNAFVLETPFGLIVSLNILLADLQPDPDPAARWLQRRPRLPAAAAGGHPLQRYAQYGVIVLLILILLPGSPLDRSCSAWPGPITRLLIGA